MNLGAIPAELRERGQWVVWRYESRDGKRTKVPYNPRDGKHAKANDPATWAGYETAVGVAAQPGVDGIGFVFMADDPFCGVDLDHCVSGDDLHPDAEAIVRRLATYSERSVSGTGAHAIGRANLNGFRRNRTGHTLWGGEFEVYDRGRFFIVTGDRLHNTPAQPVDFQNALEAVLAELFPPPATNGPAEKRPSSRTDAAVLERAFAAREWRQRPDALPRRHRRLRQPQRGRPGALLDAGVLDGAGPLPARPAVPRVGAYARQVGAPGLPRRDARQGTREHRVLRLGEGAFTHECTQCTSCSDGRSGRRCIGGRTP